jgi:prepilin-type processing-associated H-X9-DG protein
MPKLNAPPDMTGAVFSAIFCNCGSGNCIPTDWLDPKCNSAVSMLGQFGFHSNHAGGANFCFADGSVRFLKETINSWPIAAGASLPTGVSDNNGVMVLAAGTQMGVYQKLSTRAGGEMVSADQY